MKEVKLDPLANAKAIINVFAGRELHKIDGWVNLEIYQKQDFSWQDDIEWVEQMLEERNGW